MNLFWNTASVPGPLRRLALVRAGGHHVLAVELGEAVLDEPEAPPGDEPAARGLGLDNRSLRGLGFERGRAVDGLQERLLARVLVLVDGRALSTKARIASLLVGRASAPSRPAASRLGIGGFSKSKRRRSTRFVVIA